MRGVVLLFCCGILGAIAGPYLIGTGIYDCTGEITEGGFMGYAVLGHKGTGLHFRTRTRAFIIGDPNTNTRIVYVSMDLCMAMHMMKDEAILRLSKIYGNLYHNDNVILTGTHTHAAPGGYAGTALHDISTLGFNKVNFEAAVDAIVQAIVRAHNSLRPGNIFVNTGQLEGANINRSPAAYLRDPAEERAFYGHDTDRDVILLRFQADDGTEMGMINFFAVHPTSMNNTNTLVSGDNKGYASLLFEAYKNPGARPGRGKFVAAFGNSNEGDVSPNTRGPSCPDGSPCDFETSTCGGFNQGCIAKGPGKDMFESTSIIAHKQFEAAKQIYNTAYKPLSGRVDYRHMFVDFRNITVHPNFTTTRQTEKTCDPALGYSFAAGTTDGPGEFDFTQGSNNSNPFWDFISSFVAKPTEELKKCQAPKPVLLAVGLTKPMPWVDYILPLQVARVGNFYFVAVPAEFSTMAGRRLRNTVRDALKRAGALTPDTVIAIAGLANAYSHYVVTFEEYQQQRYEGGSTLYGAHTLAAHQQEFDYLVSAMIKGVPVPVGPSPPDMRNHTFSFQQPPPPDTVPPGVNFGAVYMDAKPYYPAGANARATFWCASPRQDLMTEKTFLTVERLRDDFIWEVVCDDSCWETKFHWKRVGLDQSHCTVEWDIPMDVRRGAYRFRYFGVRKDALGVRHPIDGVSGLMQVG